MRAPDWLRSYLMFSRFLQVPSSALDLSGGFMGS
jgi:hypothetical protein